MALHESPAQTRCDGNVLAVGAASSMSDLASVPVKISLMRGNGRMSQAFALKSDAYQKLGCALRDLASERLDQGTEQNSRAAGCKIG